MARIRYIKPEFFDDPVLAGCSQGARLLFIALWQVADRSGVFDPDVRKLKKYAFGYDPCSSDDVERMLGELEAIKAVCFGLVDSKTYGLIRNLKKHQKFHRDEKAAFEHVASTLEAGCQQGASTLEAGLVTGNWQLATETRDGRRATPPPARSETMLEIQSDRVTVADAKIIAGHWQDEHARLRGSTKTLIVPPATLQSARTVLTLAGGDMALAKQVITQFVESDHTYWRERGWALFLLEHPRSFEQARLATKASQRVEVGW